MEKLLYYIWKYKLFGLDPLVTTAGQRVDVVDPGVINHNAGPDFFNAKIKMGDLLWIGNVEIHERSSDWYAHGHQSDSHYNNVILHVTSKADCSVQTLAGTEVPQLVIIPPDYLRSNYIELCRTTDFPRCHRSLSSISQLLVHNFLDALLCERLEKKSSVILERVRQYSGDWEGAYFNTLARNFGFGINGDMFERWARSFSLKLAAHQRDDAFQTEALFLGQAGLLNIDAVPAKHRDDARDDEHYISLKKEYEYLAHKFNLKAIDFALWNFLRLRPQSFPYLRIVQLAQLYCSRKTELSLLLDINTRDELHALYSTHVPEYWESHYTFGSESPRINKSLTSQSLDLLLINTAVPMLFAYGTAHNDTKYTEKAFSLLAPVKAENNYIIRQWAQCGIIARNAADSQALIQLKKEYCDHNYCLHCRFGYEFLKHKPNHNIK